MAKNTGNGGGRRGAIRGRTQFRLPSGHYAKRDRQTGEILAIKADLKPFKGVVMEREPVQHDQNQVDDRSHTGISIHNLESESRPGYIAG